MGEKSVVDYRPGRVLDWGQMDAPNTGPHDGTLHLNTNSGGCLNNAQAAYRLDVADSRDAHPLHWYSTVCRAAITSGIDKLTR